MTLEEGKRLNYIDGTTEDVDPPSYKEVATKHLQVYDDTGDSTHSGTPDADTERGQWSGKLDFLMSMIAYAVGLGNVWRFPYLCFKNGGGTFLFVYLIFWVIGAVPIFLLEVTVGQHLQKGGIEVWNVCPILKGVGIGNVVIAMMCVFYYCTIITWAMYYLLVSIVSIFTGGFPWEHCGNEWNDQTTCLSGVNSSAAEAVEFALKAANMSASGEPAVEQYWERRVLSSSGSIEVLGGFQWELLIVNIFAWLIIYFALWKGITNARKFVYFCALSPYVLLVILLIRGLTLPGAGLGIHYYLMPNITKLAETTVWKDAGTQVFYSYGVGFGTLIALGSHNKYHHNSYKDAMTLCVINGSTSILAGFVVFSILGYMATIAHVEVKDIVKPGVGLAFLAYPEVASSLPLKQLWACLFFAMLTILGIDSQVCMLEGAVTAMEDVFPSVLRKNKKIFLGFICVISFIIGLIQLTHAGNYWLTVIDSYGPSGIALLFVVFFEVVGLSWGFGTDRVATAMEDMMGIRPNIVWHFLWKYASPSACILLFAFLLLKFEPIEYADKTPYPLWAQLFGGALSLASMLTIPGYAIFYLCTAKGNTLAERVRRGFTPQIALPHKARIEKEMQPLNQSAVYI